MTDNTKRFRDRKPALILNDAEYVALQGAIDSARVLGTQSRFDWVRRSKSGGVERLMSLICRHVPVQSQIVIESSHPLAPAFHYSGRFRPKIETHLSLAQFSIAYEARRYEQQQAKAARAKSEKARRAKKKLELQALVDNGSARDLEHAVELGESL